MEPERYSSRGNYVLLVKPWGLKIKSSKGSSLLEELTKAGISVDNPCGGKGTCKKCTVKILPAGEDTPVEVLSCQTLVEQDLEVTVPLLEESPDIKSGISSLGDYTKLNSCVKLHPVKLDSASHKESYQEKLQFLLPSHVVIDNPLDILKTVAPLAGKEAPLTAITVNGFLSDVKQKGYFENRDLLGIAIDLGTTTVMGVLFDLKNGTSLGTTSRENLQKIGGADVISRSTYAMEKENGLESLQEKTRETINLVIDDLIHRNSYSIEDIWEMLVVGNTTMLHLLWGISPRSLVLAPYQPVLRKDMSLPAKNFQVNINPRGRIYSAPCISGYVGADALSAVIATGLHQKERPSLLIDIGTNGEMVMGNRERLLACSTAAGPAFEGARIRHGMRGSPGAIQNVEIEESKIKTDVINGGPPKGICGSGLVDAVAAMRRYEIITAVGRFAPKETLPASLRERVQQGETGPEFFLALPEESSRPEGVSLNRKDIGELQLAKGAICAGIKILLKQLNIEMEDLEEILLAGAFGNYLKSESAARIGLWPSYPVKKVKPVGNAAGIGAQMLLLSGDLREETIKLYREIEHINLAGEPDFVNEYSDAMMLPGEPWQL